MINVLQYYTLLVYQHTICCCLLQAKSINKMSRSFSRNVETLTLICLSAVRFSLSKNINCVTKITVPPIQTNCPLTMLKGHLLQFTFRLNCIMEMLADEWAEMCMYLLWLCCYNSYFSHQRYICIVLIHSYLTM